MPLNISLATPAPITVNTTELRFEFSLHEADAYPQKKQDAGYAFLNCNRLDFGGPAFFVGGPQNPPPWLGGPIEGQVSLLNGVWTIPFAGVNPAPTPGTYFGKVTHGNQERDVEFEVTA